MTFNPNTPHDFALDVIEVRAKIRAEFQVMSYERHNVLSLMPTPTNYISLER